MKNCNPLNIRRVASTKWIGQSTLQTDRKFVQFNSMEWGIRAAFCILRTYARKYKALSVADIVCRWAPPLENPTANYIRIVCRLTGFAERQPLAEAQWPLLVKAMAFQECGVLLDDRTIARGFALYKLI